MSSLNIEQKNIGSLFKDRNTIFLIPDYQRPYSWNLEQCRILWEDIYDFAFPNGDADAFDKKDEYFLGTILTFRNEDKKDEVIDGQQRLITFLMLLRAFYAAFSDMKDTNDDDVREVLSEIEKCIWNKEPRQPLDKNFIKVESEVASDDDKKFFKEIIIDGIVKRKDRIKNHYAENYIWFQKQIEKLKMKTPNLFLDMPWRILRNCVLLPITTESQDTALRIFTTLNDRGMPLSDSDIFKAQFYKFYSTNEITKKNFTKRWKELEKICNDIFHPRTGTPLDDLFTRYMYYISASKQSRTTTLKSLRKFYEQDNYEILHNENTFEDLVSLANFWDKIYKRDASYSERVIRCLYILEYSPYNIWYYMVSVYFLIKRDSKNRLEEKNFYRFLNKIIAFMLGHSIDKPGVGAIRQPMMNEMVNIAEGKTVEFEDYKFSADLISSKRKEIVFSNPKMITRAMLAWWAFNDDSQPLPDIGIKLEIEHIYSKNRQETLIDDDSLELLGNKTLLEKGINIRASDYRFYDKKKYYLGQKKNGNRLAGTIILELRNIAEKNDDFTEDDIKKRNEKIFSRFMNYLAQNNLLK